MGLRLASALGLSTMLVLLFAQATGPAEPPDPVVLAAGDIADCNSTADSATADLLDAHAGTVLVLGDAAYEDGSAQEYAACYEPTWGRHKARTAPSPGNHDYHTPGAAGYFGYFGAAAGPAARGYYSFDLGAWHVVSLNSERGTAQTGAQVAWLKNDLASTSADCVLAFWHRPRWTSGNYSDLAAVEHLWNVLYDAGADVVLAGHDHNYQRYPPMNKQGAIDRVRGIRSFVVGTGGRHLYALNSDSRREAADDDTWGVLRLTLHPGAYSWRFLAVAGGTYADSGSDTCSSSSSSSSPPPPPPPPPSPPAPGSAAPQPLPPQSPPSSPPAGPQPSPASPLPPRRPGSAETPPVRIGRGPVRVSRSGKARVWLGCPKNGGACVGRLTIHFSPRAGTRTFAGSGSFNLRAASAKPVKLDLSNQALRRLVRRGTTRSHLVAVPEGTRPIATRSVRLVLVKARRS